MTVKELIESGKFHVINDQGDCTKEITVPFCCDLLSIAMSKAPAGAAWVTVMGNVNTIAVASLTEVSVLILAQGMKLDEFALKKARSQNIIVLASSMPIFEAAYWIYKQMHD
ncbi:MAG: hypothetical protein Q4F05_13445 [bacterium]|nr:hypothetical protein [bacterium]